MLPRQAKHSLPSTPTRPVSLRTTAVFTNREVLRIMWGFFLGSPLVLLGLVLTVTGILLPVGIPILLLGVKVVRLHIDKALRQSLSH